MFIAVVLGLLVGIIGFLPLFAGLRLTRKVTSTSNLSHMSALLLGVFGSFAILFAAAIVCAMNFRDMALPFVGGEAAALIVAAIVFGVFKMVRK